MKRSNMFRRSGGSSFRNRATSILVAATTLVGILGLGTNQAHASAVGTAWAWGANAYGELGNGTSTSSPTDTAVGVHGLASGVTTVAAGARHSLAITCNGSVVAWGKNTSGELGNGKSTNSNVPVQVSGLGPGSGVVAIDGDAPQKTIASPSGDGHSMALKSNGQVLGWGNNVSGEVGNGTASSINVVKPVAVSGLGSGSGVVTIAAGGSFSMALKSNGQVLAWGNNASGELGVGTFTDHPKPVAVSGLGSGSGVTAIAAGSAFSLALKSNGQVLAWGNNASGQLGDGNSPTDSKTPTQVTGLGPGSGVIAISAGDAFAMALKSNGTIVAWGNNQSGELGDGTTPTDHDTPVTVSGISGSTGVVAISTGYSHAMARTSTGSLYAWGRNTSGQLGDGTTSEQDTPELLSGFTNVLAVSAGGSHTLAIQSPAFSSTVNVGDASIMEGDNGTRKLTFPVTLSQPATTTVSVAYRVKASGTGAGFATAGTDFKTASGTLTFTKSKTTGMTPVLKTIAVTIYGDTKVEPDETFSVVLTGSCSCSIERGAGQGTIINDDAHAKATMGIGGGSVVEGNSGPARKVSFPITLSKPVRTTVKVTYTVSGTTAIYCVSSSGCPDADFGGKVSGSVKFVPSKKTGLTPTVRKISVPVWADLLTETDETFAVQLSSLHGLRGSQLIQSSAVGAILNDD